VTVSYNDDKFSAHTLHRIHINEQNAIIRFDIRASHLRATKLVEDRTVHSGTKEGSSRDFKSLARSIGREVCDVFQQMTPRDRLKVTVCIGEDGNVKIEPTRATALYYAFPLPRTERGYGSTPGTDLQILRDMVFTQLAWQVDSVSGKLPKQPFARRMFAGHIDATSEYLEIRHEGFKPEFISLDEQRHGQFDLTMQPVINKPGRTHKFRKSIEVRHLQSGVRQSTVHNPLTGKDLRFGCVCPD
jgi:hypothetical protein